MKKLLLSLAILVLTLTGLAAQNITLLWDASPDIAVNNYTLNWGLVIGSTHGPTNTVSTGNVTTYTLTNALSPGNTYWFTVVARDMIAGQDAPPSNEIQYSPSYPSPDRVNGFYATSLPRYPWALKFSWSAVTNLPLSGYNFYYGAFNLITGAYLSTNAVVSVAPASRSLTISNLVTGASYWFNATAVSANAVEGPRSDEVRYSVYPIFPKGASSLRQVMP